MAWSGRSAKQTFRAQIFIQVRPMYAVTPARNLPIPQLFGRSVEKRWVPGQRNSNGPSIHQRNAKGVRSKTYPCDPFVSLQCQNTDSKPRLGQQNITSISYP